MDKNIKLKGMLIFLLLARGIIACLSTISFVFGSILLGNLLEYCDDSLHGWCHPLMIPLGTICIVGGVVLYGFGQAYLKKKYEHLKEIKNQTKTHNMKKKTIIITSIICFILAITFGLTLCKTPLRKEATVIGLAGENWYHSEESTVSVCAFQAVDDSGNTMKVSFKKWSCFESEPAKTKDERWDKQFEKVYFGKRVIVKSGKEKGEWIYVKMRN